MCGPHHRPGRDTSASGSEILRSLLQRISNSPVVRQGCAILACGSGQRPDCHYSCSWRTAPSILPDLSFRQGQALIWWLPRHIGTSYISLFLSWAPHHPAKEKGRYRDTRFFTSPLGNILVLGMEHHGIHHLYPAIPLTKNAAAFREMKPILEARGCRMEHL